MHLFLLMATALFPLAAHAASYRIVAPGTTSAAGQSASLAALAQAQKNLPFLQPGDDVLFPAGMLAPNDAGTFWDIGTAAKPVFFHSPAGQYTIVSNPSYVQSGKASLIPYSSSITSMV